MYLIKLFYLSIKIYFLCTPGYRFHISMFFLSRKNAFSSSDRKICIFLKFCMQKKQGQSIVFSILRTFFNNQPCMLHMLSFNKKHQGIPGVLMLYSLCNYHFYSFLQILCVKLLVAYPLCPLVRFTVESTCKVRNSNLSLSR